MEMARTGVDGLDHVLCGGLPRVRIHLVDGGPGVGKTTLGLHFILEGLRLGEPCLYVTFGENRQEIYDVAGTHGWNLDGLEIYDHPTRVDHSLAEPQTIFHPAEVELTETARMLQDAVERVRPRRAVIDGVSELRLLSGDPLHFRHQLMLLKQFFADQQCTLLLLHDRQTPVNDAGLRTLVYGVIELDAETPPFGPERRRLRVVKMRGLSFLSGYHDCKIVTGGLQVFPRLVAAEHRRDVVHDVMSSALPQLDAMLGGGLARGTSTILVGPAGSGKSTLATQFALAAAARNEQTIFYLFEESTHVFLARAAGLNMPVAQAVTAGLIKIHPVDIGEYLPGELVARIMAAVDNGARIVVLDSLAGFLNSMSEDRSVLLMLGELFSSLGQHGVITILVVGQHGLGFNPSAARVDLSYLADNVLIFRYYEHSGVIRKAISCFKKRTGGHETAIRDYYVDAKGIVIGERLDQFRGVLTGMPTHREDLQKSK